MHTAPSPGQTWRFSGLSPAFCFTCLQLLLHLFSTHLLNVYNRRNLILSIDFGDPPPNVYSRDRLNYHGGKWWSTHVEIFFPYTSLWKMTIQSIIMIFFWNRSWFFFFAIRILCNHWGLKYFRFKCFIPSYRFCEWDTLKRYKNYTLRMKSSSLTLQYICKAKLAVCIIRSLCCRYESKVLYGNINV